MAYTIFSELYSYLLMPTAVQLSETRPSATRTFLAMARRPLFAVTGVGYLAVWCLAVGYLAVGHPSTSRRQPPVRALGKLAVLKLAGQREDRSLLMYVCILSS